MFRDARTVTELVGAISIPGIDEPFVTTRETIAGIAGQYLFAVQEAGRIYRHIASRRDPKSFVTEVSMDETDAPPTVWRSTIPGVPTP